MTYSFL